MFSFFKRSKSKDSNSGSERNDKDKPKSSGSFFNNKKSEGKTKNSDGNSAKGGSSTSPTLSTKSVIVNINGVVQENTNKLKSVVENKPVSALLHCDNNKKVINDLENNKMGNVESKQESVKPVDVENKNVGGTNKETVIQNTSGIPPNTTAIDTNALNNPGTSSVNQQSRADFFKSDKNITDKKYDIKKNSSDFSGVSEGATQTAVQEIVDLTTICRQPLKKEGTPDSDVVFKTAPNTPILSRIPVINIIELPSITEDSSNITRQNDNTSFNKQSSTETKSTNYSNCDKNLIFDTGKPQVELNNNKDKRSVQSEGSSSNNDVKKTEANSCEIKEKQTPLHNSDNKSNEAQNNELITKLKNTNIKMAEIAECSEMNNDTIIHKDVIPFADSDGDDEDISQETSRSETSNSVYHDKSSSYSEKTNQNSIEIKTDENTNSLNHHKETYLNMKYTTNDTGNIKTECNNLLTVNDRNKSNKTVIFKEQINTGLNVENENKTENSESSRETEDEASDSEMEYKEESTSAEDKKETEEEEDDNDEEVEEIEEEEEEETIEEEGTFEEKQNKNDRAENTLHVESNLVESDGINKDGIQEEDCKGSHNDEQDEEEEDDSEEEENEDNIRGQEIKEEENVEILQQATELKIKENLVNIESKADRQISDLQTELKQSEKEINNLKIQVGDLQREVIVKSSGMDRLQAELTAAYKESECVRKKLKRLEEDLDCFKQKNSDLTDELNRKTESESENDYWKVIELENEVKEQTQRIKDLENQLSVIRQERDKLAQSVAELTEEREEERKIVQEALDEAMAEKTAVQEKFEREFERLRTENSDREQKMLDDFEWKLREVESACKKRLDDKEQSSQQHIREIEGKLNIAEGKLAQLPHLKQCEQELQQLREKSIEQTRALRTATRQAEQHQNVEKLLQDEIQHLKTLLEKEKAHLATVQSIHNREVSEKDRKLQFKLEQQKNELNSEWEDKLKRDTQKIKTDLERIFRNEKQLALEEAKQQHEHKLRQLKSTWEKKHEDGVKEIDNLKHKLSEKEDEFKKELETAQTSSDRDIFELRRKLDKIDISYQEKIEKMQEKHDKEIERITEEAERKLQQCELNWQQQVGSSRTTIELVKEQMQREAQEQLQALSEHHRRQLEEQWDQLIQERDETISLMEQKHRASMEKLRGELDAIYKSRNSRETESSLSQSGNEYNPFDYTWNYIWNRLLDTLTHLRQEVTGKSNKIENLQTNVDQLHENVEVLNSEINNKNNEMIKVKQTSDEKIRQREQQLEELHQGQIMELNERHQKEITLWRNNAEELQKKVAELIKKLNENNATDMVKKIEELQKALKEREVQVANLSKEKHLYQLELMNKDSVQARQRKRGGRGGGSGTQLQHNTPTGNETSRSSRGRGTQNSRPSNSNRGGASGSNRR